MGGWGRLGVGWGGEGGWRRREEERGRRGREESLYENLYEKHMKIILKIKVLVSLPLTIS